ncbi:MAG: hypothetical protein CM1200mP18_06880 [Gammaproteobacteria bacterium]|nr:MAG: hypothetical protein CM1200mP18_06880 [Gammaproteobacteria bacterium]
MAAFVAADVNALPGSLCAEHIKDMIENHAAAGVKLHGAFQGFDMSDERLWPTYQVCQDLNVPIIAHSGPDRESKGFANHAPLQDAGFFSATSHGGCSPGWGHLDADIGYAKAYPNTYFDCCEIIEWPQSDNGPLKSNSHN